MVSIEMDASPTANGSAAFAASTSMNFTSSPASTAEQCNEKSEAICTRPGKGETLQGKESLGTRADALDRMGSGAVRRGLKEADASVAEGGGQSLLLAAADHLMQHGRR